MSVKTGTNRPALATDGAFFQSIWRLITDFEATLPETLVTPVWTTLAGGAAAALYTKTCLSSFQLKIAHIDALFSHRVLLASEAMAFYTDQDGQHRVVMWDHNTKPILGLLHPEAERRPGRSPQDRWGAYRCAS